MSKVRDFAARTGAALNVLHDCASAAGALDAGFVPGKSARENPQNPKVVYLLNADDYDDSLVDDGAFVIYQVRSFVRSFVCLFVCLFVWLFLRSSFRCRQAG
jgi:hypothetical protein